MWDGTIVPEGSHCHVTENVNLRVESTHLTSLTITDFFLSYYSSNYPIFMSNLTNECHWKKYFTFDLCGFIKNVYIVYTKYESIICDLFLYHKYKTVNKGNAKHGVSPRLKIWSGDLDLWPWKSIGFQIILRTKYVPSLVKIHWSMLILECSQRCYGRTDGR